MNSDIHDWNITFVDTGILSNVGQRLKAVEPYLRDESEFLANYSDGVTISPAPRSRSTTSQSASRQALGAC